MNNEVQSAVLKIALLGKKTEKQIIEKLVKRGFKREEISEATAYYREMGYIDHEEYARCFVADSVNLKGYGPERIRAELLKRGVEKEIAENALKGIEYELEEMMKKRFPTCSDLKEKQKIINYFVRRGYTYYEISDAFNNIYGGI